MVCCQIPALVKPFRLSDCIQPDLDGSFRLLAHTLRPNPTWKQPKTSAHSGGTRGKIRLGLRQVQQLLVYLFQLQPYGLRSEEHTSDLQSLMRISYAVFCSHNK